MIKIAKPIHEVPVITPAMGSIVWEANKPTLAEARLEMPICKNPSIADALPMLR